MAILRGSGATYTEIDRLQYTSIIIVVVGAVSGVAYSSFGYPVRIRTLSEY